jgi:hypothetical protein
MIEKNGKQITERYFGKKAIAYVYRGLKLIWMSVRSCFGSGKWVGNKPWIGKEKWKGTK